MTRLGKQHLKVGIGAANVGDLPRRRTDMADPDSLLGPAAEVDISKIHRGGFEGHVTTDVSGHPQLDLCCKGPVKRHRQGGPMLPEKSPGVEGCHHFACLVRLQQVLGDAR